MIDGGKYFAYMHNINVRESLLKGISLYMKIHHLRDTVEMKNELIERFKDKQNLNSFIKSILRREPGTAAHCRSLRNDLSSAIISKGCPTFFFTISFANLRNKVLQACLGVNKT
jgi:hypothetical protein